MECWVQLTQLDQYNGRARAIIFNPQQFIIGYRPDFDPKTDPTRKPSTHSLKTRLDMSHREARANPAAMHRSGVGCVKRSTSQPFFSPRTWFDNCAQVRRELCQTTRPIMTRPKPDPSRGLNRSGNSPTKVLYLSRQMFE